MKIKGLPQISKRAIAVNAVAGLIIVAGFTSFMQNTFARPHFEVCSARYSKIVSLPLDNNGTPLTPAEVQAVANGLDEGTLENLSIGAFSEGPSKFAMGIKLAAGTMEQRSTRGTPGGISLPWSPSAIEQPQAACLSYNVFLPKDFAFGYGGTLPGLFGTNINGQFGDTPSFQMHPTWANGGATKLYLRQQVGDETLGAQLNSYDAKLPRGRWVRIEQELVLNAPKSNDGIARLWIDGRLEADIKGINVRAEQNMAILGVAGEIYYGGLQTGGSAPKDDVVWVTPYQLRWN